MTSCDFNRSIENCSRPVCGPRASSWPCRVAGLTPPSLSPRPYVLIHAEEVLGIVLRLDCRQPLIVAAIGRADAIFSLSIMKFTYAPPSVSPPTPVVEITPEGALASAGGLRLGRLKSLEVLRI